MEMMAREMLQRNEKILVTTPLASYAVAASINAGPGERIRFVSSKEPVALMAKEQDVLERRMNVIVRGVEEIDSEWQAEGYMKKAYDMEQGALIALAKAPEYTWKDYKEAIQQCVRLGKEAGQRSRSGKGKEWTVVGPKSKPRLLPKKRLEEGNRLSKEERKEAEQDKFNYIPKRFCRMARFRGWWKGYTRFRMLRRLRKRNVMPLEIEEEVVMCSFCPRIVHDKDINDYQVARSRRADDEIVSRL
jgi:hypothetical protein